MLPRVGWLRLLALLLPVVSACRDRTSSPAPAGSAPPPLASVAKPGACSAGGGTVSDPATASVFPRAQAGYCVDPNGETRVFGDGEKLSMDAICTEAFDGECEVYKGFGLKRVVHIRYVDGAGSPGSIEIYLSKFATIDGAYGMFAKRVIADGDPAETAPRPLEAGAAAAIGTGRAYVYKGAFVAEIQYANEDETPPEMKASGDRVIVPLAKTIGQKLDGPDTIPVSATKLPAAHLIPLGIGYEPKEVLRVAGTGPGALGYYKDGDKRYRVVIVVRSDVDQAKDVLKSFGKTKGAVEEKGLGEGGYRLSLSDREGTKIEWIVARAGTTVFGVGDEELTLEPGSSAAEREKVTLSRDDKLAKLRALLQ